MAPPLDPSSIRDSVVVAVDGSGHAHLLVVGSRGRGVVRSMLLGSVSRAVSAHASCPVVVCRPPGESDVRTGVIVGADATVAVVPQAPRSA